MLNEIFIIINSSGIIIWFQSGCWLLFQWLTIVGLDCSPTFASKRRVQRYEPGAPLWRVWAEGLPSQDHSHSRSAADIELTTAARFFCARKLSKMLPKAAQAMSQDIGLHELFKTLKVSHELHLFVQSSADQVPRDLRTMRSLTWRNAHREWCSGSSEGSPSWFTMVK